MNAIARLFRKLRAQKEWLGSGILVAAFQQYYFVSFGINKKKCEAFFSNLDNFDRARFNWWKAHPELDLMFR
jgi:hypothetical protein